MLMLDLCCGLGGASRAMQERGWDVIRVDINPEFSPDIVADITTFHYTGPQPDLVWASPPALSSASGLCRRPGRVTGAGKRSRT